MTTEPKEAINLVKNFTKMDFNNSMGWTGYYDTELKELQQAIEIVLNLIQEQQTKLKRLDKEAQSYFETTIKQAQTFDSQLQKKDKMIDLMARKLNQAYFDEDKFCTWFEKMMGVQQKMDYGYVVDLIKQYFEESKR